jgi:hypothetical protein
MTRTRTSFESLVQPVILLLAALLLVIPVKQSSAHALEQSYVFLTVSGDAIDGRIEVNIPDLNLILGANLPTDGSVTREDIAPYVGEIRDYLTARVGFAPEGTASKSLPLTDYEVTTIPLTQYFVYHFSFPDLAFEPDYVDVDYGVLFDEFPNHRGLLVIETNWETGTFQNEAQVSLTFSGNNVSQRLDLSDSSVWRGFTEMVRLGTHHIWIGIDHILFLLALLLPSAMRRHDRDWAPVGGFKPALIYVIKVVTIFTIAHTITLSLAAMNAVSIPSRLVESIIALSIAIAAAEIIYPVFRGRIWIIVFAFGLFHGFGFASVLGEIGIPPRYMVYSLLGFNLGVEIGQVAIVCIIFPLLYMVRNWWAYPRLVMRFGSLMLIAVSLYWFVERGFEVDLPAGAIVNSVIDRLT